MSNGKAVFLDGVDGRSVLARRYRDILLALVSDMGGDPSEAQSLIARRAATLAVWCEQTEAAMAKGEDIVIGEFASVANSLRRLLESVGLQRQARDVSPSLAGYLTRRPDAISPPAPQGVSLVREAEPQAADIADAAFAAPEPSQPLTESMPPEPVPDATPEPARPPQVGERIAVAGTGGAFIVLVAVEPDQRERWMVYDGCGQHLCNRFGQANAEAWAREKLAK